MAGQTDPPSGRRAATSGPGDPPGLSYFRLLTLASAVIYPAWGVFCALLVPGSANDWPGRLATAAVFLALHAASHVRPALATRPDRALAVGFGLVTLHYGYLVYLNHYAAFWIVGIFITLGAIDVCFTEVAAFVGYTLWVAALAGLFAWLAPPGGELVPLMLMGLMTVQLLFGISLTLRVRLQQQVEQLAIQLRERGDRLAEQNAHLHQLDQLKTNFVSAVTHELRTPLTSIRGYTELLEEVGEERLTPEDRGFVAQIARAAARLEHLVDDMLDAARLEAGSFTLHLEEGDLAAKAAEIVDSLRPQGEEARVAIAPTLPEQLVLPMDAQRVGQVLANLLGNAVKFSPAGGTVRLAVIAEPDAALVEVADEGEGIAPEELPRLFQRFSQLTAGLKRRSGTGLGLSIAKALVEAHGGQIGVRSQPGQGTTFWFRLPRVAPAAKPGT